MNVAIIDDEEYEKNKNFFLQLFTPRLVSESESGSSNSSDTDSGFS